jgi:hypothetical protein
VGEFVQVALVGEHRAQVRPAPRFRRNGASSDWVDRLRELPLVVGPDYGGSEADGGQMSFADTSHADRDANLSIAQ